MEFYPKYSNGKNSVDTITYAFSALVRGQKCDRFRVMSHSGSATGV